MKIVAVANQKGGVGKTTVAMQVAASLSRHHRVLVVDTDPQQSTVSWAEKAGVRLPFDFAGSQRPKLLGRLDRLDVEYDFVLVDTPGDLEHSAILEAVLDASDFVLIPMTPESLAVEPTMRTIGRLIDPRHLRHAVVLNKIDPRVPGQNRTWQDVLDTKFGAPRLEAYIRQHKAQSDIRVLGQLVTTMPDTRRTAGVISDVTRVAHELIEEFAVAGPGRW